MPHESKPRLYATCDIGREALDRLRQSGYPVDVHPQPEAPPHEEILRQVRSGIIGLITTLRDPIDAEILKAGAGSLWVVAQDAVGLDNIDLDAATRFGIPVVHTPEVLTDATAEFALFLLGAVSRKIMASERLVRQGGWKLWHPYLPFLGDEVSGKTVGIVGLGRIGKSFALKCSGLGVDLVTHTRSPDLDFAESLQEIFELHGAIDFVQRRQTFSYVGLEECLRRADYLSLHVPLTEETRHLIDALALSRMKATAYLINTARGAVVDEQALCGALKEERIAGAALDVFSQEPLPQDSPLRDPSLEDRLLLTHHLGSGTYETRLSADAQRGMAGRCVQGVLDVLEGSWEQRWRYVANREALKRRRT